MSCEACPSNRFCDGSLNDFPCDPAASCNNGEMICADNTFYIENGKCVKCSASNICNGTHSGECDSSLALDCSDNVLKKCRINYYIAFNMMCLPCQTNSICNDGVNSYPCSFYHGLKCDTNLITQCIVGYMLVNSSCVVCDSNTVCDGTDIFYCRPNF